MGYWHYSCLILPKKEFMSFFPEKPFALKGSEIENLSWWKTVQPPADFEIKISKILPKAESWSSEISVWGTVDGDRITIAYEDENVQEIEVRLDARVFNESFLVKILELVREMDGLIYTWDYHIIEPKFELLKLELNEYGRQLIEDPNSLIVKRGFRYRESGLEN